MKDKKALQLGMNASTASGRLVKDLLWDFIVKTDSNYCHHCGAPMERDNFSIEHKTPWLDSADPKGLFFDINNISYSHLRCNISAARKPHQKFFTKEEFKEKDRVRKKLAWDSLTKEEQQARRREKYRGHGK